MAGNMAQAGQVDPVDASASLEPLACVSCRSRKLKCDRTKPACARCTKVDNECVYPESRRKPTFKRRNVKELEARLAQVEEYLKEANNGADEPRDTQTESDTPELELGNFTFDNELQDHGSDAVRSSAQSQSNFDKETFEVTDFDKAFGKATLDMPGINVDQRPPVDGFDFGGQLVDLGMTEATPPLEVIEELHTLFFRGHYHFLPIIHPGTYFKDYYGTSAQKPPMGLQYIIWAAGAHKSEKYDQYADIFYKRARQYIDADEMSGKGQNFLTLRHVQAYATMASFEAKCLLFTRAAMSSSRCTRLMNMLGLDRIDGPRDGRVPLLPPATSWVELEERRRVFWGAFTIDAHASISAGWPSLIDVDQTLTKMPSSEQAFVAAQDEEAFFLDDVFSGARYSTMAAMAVVCQMFKSIWRHVHRGKPSDRPDDVLHGAFWARHRDLENKLSSIFMFLPDKLRLPQNQRDPSAISTNLNLHACIICLHHAAVEMIDKYELSETIKETSVSRMWNAAQEIINIVRLTSHTNAMFKSPLCALALYCTTTVFVYKARSNPDSGLSPIEISDVEMILQSMYAIGRVHDITRSFMRQACQDIERYGLSHIIRLPVAGAPHGPTDRRIYVPLIARTPASKHDDLAGCPPGELPLGDKENDSLTSNNDKADYMSYQELLTSEGGTCFSTIMTPAARNMARVVGKEQFSHKRKRMSASPGPTQAQSETVERWRVRTSMMQGRIFSGSMVLPDRTNSSSASSPLNRTAETISVSSHTSPSVGLGNTVEENRFDLRQFQNRVAAPLWSGEPDQGIFPAVTDSMVNSALESGDAWRFLSGDLDWDNTLSGA